VCIYLYNRGKNTTVNQVKRIIEYKIVWKVKSRKLRKINHKSNQRDQEEFIPHHHYHPS